MKLLILAGGFGTRIQSVVADVPKALAPVSGIPFLKLQIENWRNQGVSDFIFLLHYKSELIADFLDLEKNYLLKNCKVRCLVEEVPLDTGGALAHAVAHFSIEGDFLVVNADTWLGCGIQEVILSKAPSIAVVKVTNASRYGYVEFNKANSVIAFHEKNFECHPGWINAGLGHFHADLFANWNQKSFSLENEKYPEWTRKMLLKAVPLNCDFIDIGIPEDYRRLNHWIDSGKVGKL